MVLGYLFLELNLWWYSVAKKNGSVNFFLKIFMLFCVCIVLLCMIYLPVGGGGGSSESSQGQ